MDVLAYSAFNAQEKLKDTLATKQSELTSANSAKASAYVKYTEFSPDALCWIRCREQCLLRSPHCYNQWVGIPSLSADEIPDTQAFKVCTLDKKFNCGASCTWTVPAGATMMRFQIWGAGGGSGMARCCGGSAHGATGAYASVMLPATAGCTYTLCAGCAYACWPFSPGNNVTGREPGYPSYVQGYGLENFCAEGGSGRMGTWMGQYGKYNHNRFAAIGCDSGGSCFCNEGSFWCYASSCSTGAAIQYIANSSYFGHVTHPNACGNIVYGIRGMWPRFSCITTNNYYCTWSQPIYPWAESAITCDSYTHGSCGLPSDCGGNKSAENGYKCFPGAGGYHSHAMAGLDAGRGDAGRSGMVCVQWI